MQGFRSHWWKALGAILVLYSIYLGTSTEVGPGGVRVTPDNVSANSSFEVQIEGYNTHFKDHYDPKEGGVHVWYKVLGKLQKAKEVKVVDANHLLARFDGVNLNTDTSFVRSGTIVIEDVHHGMFLGSKMLALHFDKNAEAGLDSLENASVVPQKRDQAYFSFPYRYLLYETIRNLNFHVPMWFTMIVILLISFIYSISHLNTGKRVYDIRANAFAKVGLLFGLMGIATGMFWANYAWGTPWTKDPKLNGAAVGVLMYIAYQILRGSIDDEGKVARISAVYNVLAFPIFIVLIIVLPRLAEFSLHPGAGDSVGFSTYDLNNHLRKVFYPAVLGWILVGAWVSQLTARIDKLINDKEWK